MERQRGTDVVIVGAGPAGISTALHLQRHHASWADRIVVVDRAAFPREKLCGGGITNNAFETRLGLSTTIVPTMQIESILALTDDDKSVLPLRFRVVRRAELDAALVREARARGIVVHENVDVQDIATSTDAVTLSTNVGEFETKMLIAADGSNSTIRKRLKWPGESHIARLLEVITPEADDAASDDDLDGELDSAWLCAEHFASFDFTATRQNLQGYYWDFPSFVGGHLHMNRGVYDSRVVDSPLAHLPEILRAKMAMRKRTLGELHGHPIRWYHPDGVYSRPRILLAGDAAGVDPLFGEGITFAFDYGELAAEMIVEAFAKNDFDLSDYGKQIRGHRHLGLLARNYRLARLVYGSRNPTRALGRLARLLNPIL